MTTLKNEMPLCDGRGTCINTCYCPCFDGLTYDTTQCTCGHSNHNGFCKTNCCELVECHNNRMCGVSVPQYVLDENGGTCYNCKKNYGKLNYVEMSMTCAVCSRKMEMIELPCGHLTCILCWRSNTYVECVQCSFDSLKEAAKFSEFMDMLAYRIVMVCFLILFLLSIYIYKLV